MFSIFLIFFFFGSHWNDAMLETFDSRNFGKTKAISQKLAETYFLNALYSHIFQSFHTKSLFEFCFCLYFTDGTWLGSFLASLEMLYVIASQIVPIYSKVQCTEL